MSPTGHIYPNRWERGINEPRISAEAAREAERSAPNINDPPPS